MTSMTDAKDFRFMPWQEGFIEELQRRIKSGRLFRLIAPIGSGKSFAVSGGIASLMQQDQIRRVLVLSPMSVLVAQWGKTLSQHGVKAAVLDGAAFRTMRNDYPNPEAFPKGAFSLSLAAATRNDTEKWLSEIEWDFVIVDEAHNMGRRGKGLIERLLAQSKPPAVLLATIYPDDNKHEFQAKWQRAHAEMVQRGDRVINWPPMVQKNVVAASWVLWMSDIKL